MGVFYGIKSMDPRLRGDDDLKHRGIQHESFEPND